MYFLADKLMDKMSKNINNNILINAFLSRNNKCVLLST